MTITPFNVKLYVSLQEKERKAQFLAHASFRGKALPLKIDCACTYVLSHGN